jgi:transcriptional regulator with XRE-family HTH domain
MTNPHIDVRHLDKLKSNPNALAKSGITKGRFNQLYSGHSSPTNDEINKIAKALGINPIDLYQPPK